MKIEIDHHSDVPVYKQLMTAIGDMILSGDFTVGEQLPSVRKLATDLGINPNTVAKVFTLLQSDGYVDSKPGVGYYVTSPSDSSLENRLKELDESVKEVTSKMILFGLSEEKIAERISGTVREVLENGRGKG